MKLLKFIGEGKSGWICTEINNGDRGCAHSGGYFTSLSQVVFFPSEELENKS